MLLGQAAFAYRRSRSLVASRNRLRCRVYGVHRCCVSRALVAAQSIAVEKRLLRIDLDGSRGYALKRPEEYILVRPHCQHESQRHPIPHRRRAVLESSLHRRRSVQPPASKPSHANPRVSRHHKCHRCPDRANSPWDYVGHFLPRLGIKMSALVIYQVRMIKSLRFASITLANVSC